MKEKIDWYQEVLDLEPSSKVFFPLAKLLVKDDSIERAVRTLQQGLDRHPEFIEARLYLIDLLYSRDMHAACEAQLELLSPLFLRYAGFWQAWGSTMLASGKKDNTGLAVSLLAAFFKDTSLSMSDIFIKGLEDVLRKEKKEQLSSATQQTVNTPTGYAQQPEPPQAQAQKIQEHIALAQEQNVVQQTQASPVPAPMPEPVQTQPITEQVQTVIEQPQEEAPLPSPSMAQIIDQYVTPLHTEAVDTEKEPFSLRTRSMAEVLAEQGDYAGALEIYQELVHAASSTEEKMDLEQRMNTLQHKLNTIPEKVTLPENEQDSSGKFRVLSVLEALAERLENRISG